MIEDTEDLDDSENYQTTGTKSVEASLLLCSTIQVKPDNLRRVRPDLKMFTNVENITTTEHGVDTPEPTEEDVAVESTYEHISGEEPTEIFEKKRTFGAHLLLQRQGNPAPLKSVRGPLYM